MVTKNTISNEVEKEHVEYVIGIGDRETDAPLPLRAKLKKEYSLAAVLTGEDSANPNWKCKPSLDSESEANSMLAKLTSDGIDAWIYKYKGIRSFW